MTKGSKHPDRPDRPLDVQGDGQSAGLPAEGQVEGSSQDPLGEVGVRHWQASYISHTGLDDRSSVFFAAVEMTRMPMVITDPRLDDNPIVFANRAFMDLTGYEEAEFIGRNCRFLQGPDTDPDTVAELHAAVAEHRAAAVDILNYKADGSPFWNALFLGPIFDEHGTLLYFFASQVDITRRRTSEQSFRQAQKMEAIGQLTAGLAHDFNNLLQVIAGNLELAALQAEDNSALATAIDNAQRAAERGARVTQHLLAFARKQRLDPKFLNLNTLVLDFSDMAVRALGDRVQLRLDLRPGLPACRLDPTHMEMALLNVLLNARDAMPDGGEVTIATALLNQHDKLEARQLPAGTYVMICIIDRGLGMPPEVARRAIEPFFTTKEPGTGLGLAMVHGFVQQSHGRLEIDSHPGEGTLVKMIFPVANDRVAEQPAHMKDATGDADSKEVVTVLLVEDSDDVRQVTEGHLHSLGYRVLSAASGEEALRLLDKHGRVDVLFTDVMMPGGMNGLVLSQRARERYPDLPVLLATGYTDELSADSYASEMAVLAKPYRRRELADRIRSALESTRRSGRTGPHNYRHEG